MKLQSMGFSVLEQYTPFGRFQIVELYIKNNYSIVKTQREFRAKFESRSAPAKNNIIQMTATAGLIVPHSINPISSLQMKPISTSEAISISTIAAFGAQKIHTSLRSQCTHNELLLGADCGTVASLGHFSSKRVKESTLRSMASVTVPCSTDFCFQKLKRKTWTTFGFNRTVPLDTEPT